MTVDTSPGLGQRVGQGRELRALIDLGEAAALEQT